MKNDYPELKGVVAGIADMQQLATMICNLRYDALDQLFFSMHNELHRRSIACIDIDMHRFKLRQVLLSASKYLWQGSIKIKAAWQISIGKKDCSAHKTDIAGITNMQQLARVICNLPYKILSDLLFEIQTALHNDSIADLDRKRFQLSHCLHKASHDLFDASINIESAWMISKHFNNKSK